MKVLLLGDPASPHIIKWAKSLDRHKIEVQIYGLSSCNQEVYAGCKYVRVKSLGVTRDFVSKPNRGLSKVVYLNALRDLKSLLQTFKPDILHAHYATSYGLLGALSRYRPFILSLWGSDVFEFPRKSFFHRQLLRFNLSAADVVFSTSDYMAMEARKYTSKEVFITPFGIDTDFFSPAGATSIFGEGAITVGTVKHLEHIYGIDLLLKSFKMVVEQNPDRLIKLMIVGGGSQERYLKQLAQELGISADVMFVGKVAHDQVIFYHSMLSIAVYLSREESFGVSVLESSACGKPVVVSNVGGFAEIVKDNVTGLIVPVESIFESAQAISQLVWNEELRLKMGQAGAEHVRSNFNWEETFSKVLDVYHDYRSKRSRFADGAVSEGIPQI